MSQASLAQVFSSIPRFEGFALEDFSVSPLPGYTNDNFRLRNKQHDWVLRIPRPATDHFIDRQAEAHNQSLAHKLGLAPQVTWRNSTGVTLTPTLDKSRSLEARDLASPERLHTLVMAIQRLHRSGLCFQGRVNLGELLETHFALLEAADKKRFQPRLSQARRVVALLDGADATYVASHNDLVAGNLLFDNSRLWIIDWEYSAMASPYWDLATLCNESDLDLAQSRQLLQAYSVGGVQMKEATLFDYRGLLKLLGDCWMTALAD